MILGCVQPAYLAWLPMFKRMRISDVFVYLDDVEYSKNSPHNRNRIKTPNGPIFLTVPVQYKGHSRSSINDIPIANHGDWAHKHWRSIEMNYSKAAFFPELAPVLKPLYERRWERLGDLNIALIEAVKDFLGIKTPCYRSSELSVEGRSNEKLVNLCRKMGADKFVVKPGTEDYHPTEFFASRGVGFEYFDYRVPEYAQLYGGFTQGLSALDFAMNCGRADF
jgi:hypothetical protein